MAVLPNIISLWRRHFLSSHFQSLLFYKRWTRLATSACLTHTAHLQAPLSINDVMKGMWMYISTIMRAWKEIWMRNLDIRRKAKILVSVTNKTAFEISWESFSSSLTGQFFITAHWVRGQYHKWAGAFGILLLKTTRELQVVKEFDDTYVCRVLHAACRVITYGDKLRAT